MNTKSNKGMLDDSAVSELLLEAKKDVKNFSRVDPKRISSKYKSALQSSQEKTHQAKAQRSRRNSSVFGLGS
ncbi:MAG: hypothetical protein MK137_07925 [Rickettsiales bacterium]|nr:hypothetical protein [Rickettsiales bacterium]